MKQWLFNPFVYVAGLRALTLGLGIMVVTAIISYISGANFHGMLSIHTGLKAPLYIFFLEQVNAWGCSVLLFYLSSILFSRSAVRLIDIAGTLALARWPMIFLSLAGFIPLPTGLNDLNAAFVVTEIVSVLIEIWVIALMYNAYRISGNLKGERATISFIAVLIIGEIISNAISHQLLKHII